MDDAVTALMGYQLHLITSGGRSGQLQLLDITVEPHGDSALGDRAGRYTAFNTARGQMLCGVEQAVAIRSGGYLAT